MAVTCVLWFPYSASQCDPPASHQQNELFLGNMNVRNDWCVDNAKLSEIMSVLYFLGYVSYHFAQSFQGKDPWTMPDYIHHSLSGMGCIAAVFAGRYVATMATLSMIVEISTPFKNFRELMVIHKTTGSPWYLYNGAVFTLTFLVFRVIFQTWMVCMRLLPALVRDNYASSETLFIQFCTIFTITLYTALMILNYYWFWRISMGCYKVMMKGSQKKR